MSWMFSNTQAKKWDLRPGTPRAPSWQHPGLGAPYMSWGSQTVGSPDSRLPTSMSNSSQGRVQIKWFTQLCLHHVSWTNINNYIRKNVFTLVSRHIKWVQNDVEHTPFIPASLRRTNNLTGGTQNSTVLFFFFSSFLKFYCGVLNIPLLVNIIWNPSQQTSASSIYFARALLMLTRAASWKGLASPIRLCSRLLSVQYVTSTERPNSLTNSSKNWSRQRKERKSIWL